LWRKEREPEEKPSLENNEKKKKNIN